MPIEYNQNRQLEAVNEILYSLSLWLASFPKYALYPKGEVNTAEFPAGNPVKKLAEFKWDKNILSDEGIKLLEKKYDDFEHCYHRINSNLELMQTPIDYPDFCELLFYYELFLISLHDLQKKLIAGSDSIDRLTGLKNNAALTHDLFIEMERYGRNGQTFAVGLLHVINFKRALSENQRDQMQDYIRYVSLMIKKAVRAYDDAYYIGNGEFVVTVKQSDLTGGLAVLERLKDFMDAKAFDFTQYGLPEDYRLISCCVVEPMLDEEIDDLITGMRRELAEAESEGRKDILLEYFKQSPFQKFLSKQNS